MMGHKMCFYGEIWTVIVILKLSQFPFLIWSTENSQNDHHHQCTMSDAFLGDNIVGNPTTIPKEAK